MNLKAVLLMFVLVGISVVFAEDNGKGTVTGNLSGAAFNLCTGAQNLLKVGMVLMIVLGAATYALGQLLSAEIRGRATVWATAMFMAALFAAVIYVLVPYVIGYILNNKAGSISSDCEVV